MTVYVDYGGYEIAEREAGNGWYSLATLVMGMGEEYRVYKRYDHKPTEEDYADFVRYAEATR